MSQLKSKTVEIIIGPGGSARHLTTRAANRLACNIGPVCGRIRASRVETAADLGIETSSPHQFFAELAPVGGPCLGPFDEREDAVAAEQDWLCQHGLPG